MYHITFHIIILLVVLVCPSIGQAQTNKIESLINDKVDVEAGYCSFFIKKGNTKILVLQNLQTGKETKFLDTDKKTVLNEEVFICGNKNYTWITHLKTQVTDVWEGNYEYFYLKKDSKVVLINRENAVLEILSLDTRKKQIYKNVASGKINTLRDKIAILLQDSTVEIIGAGVNERFMTSIKDRDGRETLVWSMEDELFSYLLSGENLIINKYPYGKAKPLKKVVKLPVESDFKIDPLNPIRFIDQNDLIWLNLKNREIRNSEKTSVEIWSGTQPRTSAELLNIKNHILSAGIYDFKNEKLSLSAVDQSVRYFKYGFGKTRVMAYNPFLFEDFTKIFPDIQPILYDLSKKDSVVFNRMSGHVSAMAIARNGEWFFYFHGKDWRGYNTVSGERRNITAHSASQFYKESRNVADSIYDPSGKIIFSTNKDIIFIYDRSDIWLYNLSFNFLRKITNGSEIHKIYRFEESDFIDLPDMDVSNNKVVDYTKKILLKAVNTRDYSEELAFWCPKLNTVKLVVKEEGKIKQVKRSGGSLTYVFERFDTPPLLKISEEYEKNRILFRSNTSDILTKSQKRTILTWKKNGKEARVLVKYPQDYDEQVKYPAVFNIYEKKVPGIFSYETSSDYKGGGFNSRHFTEAGYFVIEPDLEYDVGAPGFSATEYLLNAVQVVLEKLSIDPERMGLIGHSFGGYQVNFVATQTDLFKAAVSGAGFSDLMQGYLTMKWDTSRPDFWQFEEQQMRMGESVFNNYQSYLNNSPVYHVGNVNTPLLLWSGKQDFHVSWSQSVSMFLSLKRLDKETVLLLYPEEGHVLEQFENKKDLGIKIKEWFDYYLKDYGKPLWIN